MIATSLQAPLNPTHSIYLDSSTLSIGLIMEGPLEQSSRGADNDDY